MPIFSESDFGARKMQDAASAMLEELEALRLAVLGLFDDHPDSFNAIDDD